MAISPSLLTRFPSCKVDIVAQCLPNNPSFYVAVFYIRIHQILTTLKSSIQKIAPFFAIFCNQFYSHIYPPLIHHLVSIKSLLTKLQNKKKFMSKGNQKKKLRAKEKLKN